MNDSARAWAPFVPTANEPWDLARVAHLHRRAGFAASWATLERDVKEGVSPSVERLLDGEPATTDGRSAAEFASATDAMAYRFGASGNLTRLQGFWLRRMIDTPHSLLERMTLFWHDHFATSDAKVKNVVLMARQNALIRRHALGNFKALLAEMGRDPAMLLWLDSAVNRKAHPNENYAREVMELFALGRGHYSEKDIQEAARALTGGFIQGDEYKDVAAQHDDGPKTILGQTGRYRGEDVPRILLEQPACAEFLCNKLFGLFVSEVDVPSRELIAPLADALRQSGYEIRVPVRMVLRSRLFHDAGVRRRRVKSPAELAVGTIRALEVLHPTVSADALADACVRMGQSLYAPPSVAGWDGGPAWINTTTTLARTNFALGLLSDTDAGLGKRFNSVALAERHGAAKDPARFYVDLLVQDAFGAELRARVKGSAREAATVVLTAPEYQLA
jgi:uncharacterized protein (DUF1800 family)